MTLSIAPFRYRSTDLQRRLPPVYHQNRLGPPYQENRRRAPPTLNPLIFSFTPPPCSRGTSVNAYFTYKSRTSRVQAPKKGDFLKKSKASSLRTPLVTSGVRVTGRKKLTWSSNVAFGSVH